MEEDMQIKHLQLFALSDQRQLQTNFTFGIYGGKVSLGVSIKL